jgi:hypothetical protein
VVPHERAVLEAVARGDLPAILVVRTEPAAEHY